MADEAKKLGTVAVHVAMHEPPHRFADSSFSVVGHVHVHDKDGTLVGFFPNVHAVTFEPNKDL